MLLLLLLTLIPSLPCLKIVSRYVWGANPLNAEGKTLTRITDIVIGNEVLPGSAECATKESCYVWLRSLQQRDIETGTEDLKFNFYVSSVGDVYEGVGWNKQGSFTKSYASSSLGIAYLGDFSSGISTGVEAAIIKILKSGYLDRGTIQTEFCTMFTCDTALKNGALQGPQCPGGTTYSDLRSWEILRNVSAHHVYRPCGCGGLDPPSNGKVTYSSYDVGSDAKYSCHDGFELIGESKRTCEISGAWSDLSVNAPNCVDPKRGLIIVPKRVWDVVVEEREFIEGGFPIATFFIDVADRDCVNDSDCRAVLKELKKAAWDDDQEKDVLCNFYIAKTGIVYEGRGWGVKGAYTPDIRQTQGLCFLGEDAFKSTLAVDTLFKLINEAIDTKKVSYDGFCFQTKCLDEALAKGAFCNTVQNLMGRQDRLEFTNKYCEPDPLPLDNRAPALECRHKKQHDTWLNYEGTKSVSVSGCSCLNWEDQTTTQHHFYPEVYKYASLTSNYCRNPDMRDDGPWCITDASCKSAGIDSCAIPQCEGEYCFEKAPFGCSYYTSPCYVGFCTAAISFSKYSAMRYILDKTMSTDTDKLTMTVKPNDLTARLIRVEGEDPSNYWDIALVQGAVKVVMSLSHGDDLTVLDIVSEKKLIAGASSTIQIMRKNHKVLLRINDVETKYLIPVDVTANSAPVQFLKPQKYTLGRYLVGDDVFTGCMADVVFNRDNLFAVATDSDQERGQMIKEDISDDGCLTTLPFEWGNIDIVTTAAPITVKPTNAPVTDLVKDKTNSNLPYIIIGVVILVIILVLLIGCFIFKRHNRDKGVYNVDEAITTKWDWKKGILPVLTDTKRSSANYDQIATNSNDSPEVFA